MFHNCNTTVPNLPHQGTAIANFSDFRNSIGMEAIIILQVATLILTIAVFYTIFYLSKQSLSRIRTKTRTAAQTNRHLTQAATYLARARTATLDKPKSQNLAKHALEEVQTAVSLSPREPQPHVVKSHILEFMGHENSALKSIDSAIKLPRVKSFARRERGDLLAKRAELKMKVNKKRLIDSAIEDLKEAVKLRGGECDSRVYTLLSQCHELKRLKGEKSKRRAIEDGSRVQPGSMWLAAGRSG